MQRKRFSTVRPGLRAAALALGVNASVAAAQTGEVVTITGKANADAAIAGFGAVPASRLPMQITSLGRDALADAGVASLAGLTRIDASLADAYNAEGYWSSLTVRGFVIDNRSNYRRDGLPINAETHLSLANVERIEVLKGTSGIQSGVSAPGGLVNLVIKRPTTPVRQASFAWQQDATLTAQADVGERFGARSEFGVRLNLQAAQLRPAVRNADGSSHTLAVAADWQLSTASLVEFEIERSHRSQPSVPGFSLLGERVPDARTIDPRLSLNNQTWSLPVVLDGRTASLRFTQQLGADWRWVAHAAQQRLRSDDRVAFPFGCYDAAADRYWADRYCPDGSVDLYDFRSDGERRRVNAFELRAEGSVQIASLRHQLSVGVLRSRNADQFGPQVFNFSGTGHIDGTVATPAAPEPGDPANGRNTRSDEVFLQDAVVLTPAWRLWGGVRSTSLERTGLPRQQFTAPSLALSWSPQTQTLAYASWGQGVETEVAPNLPIYRNAGQALPALKSWQFELGIKHQGQSRQWSAAWFDIQRPLAADRCEGQGDNSCTRAIDGAARHRGAEAQWLESIGPWSMQLSAMALKARREGASDTALNGLRPTNVPATSLRMQLTHSPVAVPGLSLSAAFSVEGDRMVLPDNSARIPAWSRWDLGARYRSRMGGVSILWRLDLQNATNTRAWREAPYQFAHAYLFPMPARNLRASAQLDF
jgi:iron complex outermembrane recepter protein